MTEKAHTGVTNTVANAALPPASPSKVTSVQINLSTLLKILQHARESNGQGSGQLLGFDNQKVLEVTDAFPYPMGDLEEEEHEEYIANTLKVLRDFNADNNSVGWYQSCLFDNFINYGLLEDQLAYQNRLQNAILLVVDLVRSASGPPALHALRLKENFQTLHKERKSNPAHSIATVASLVEGGLFEELSVSVSISALEQIFILQQHQNGLLPTAGTPSIVPIEELLLKDAAFDLVRAIDEVLAETGRVQHYLRTTSKQQQALNAQLLRLKHENAQRSQSGEEALPLSSVTANFRPTTEPSRIPCLIASSSLHFMLDNYKQPAETLEADRAVPEEGAASERHKGDYSGMALPISKLLKGLGRPFRVLAIETSCDDTAVCLLDSSRRILSEVNLHQHSLNAQHGGIVPSLAASSHKLALPDAIKQVLDSSQLQMHEVDLIAATRGPGIASCLTTGFEAGRLLSTIHQKPFYPIHHVEGHILMTRMETSIPFPFLTLMISGGHTVLLLAQGISDYLQLGTTLDDSVGEAVDKAARTLGLPYHPGMGPAATFVEAALRGQRDSRIRLPSIKSRHMTKGLDFSFSGVKAAFSDACDALRDDNGQISESDRENLAWSFLGNCSEQIIDRVEQALELLQSEGVFPTNAPLPLVICGGAARNKFFFTRFSEKLGDRCRIFRCAPKHCVDNAVMIGWAAIEQVMADLGPLKVDTVRQDWPLVELKLELEALQSFSKN